MTISRVPVPPGACLEILGAYDSRYCAVQVWGHRARHRGDMPPRQDFPSLMKVAFAVGCLMLIADHGRRYVPISRHRLAAAVLRMYNGRDNVCSTTAGDFTADVPISADRFLWGATVTAHAVEGRDFDSDWWRWEQRPRRVREGATSEVAADHLNRYQADVKLAPKFGLNCLQYGLSWARIEPQPGQFDEQALGHYADVFKTLADCGITPIAALQEHSLPAWFAEQDSWFHPEAPARFLAYAARVYEAIAPWCQHWLPPAEPALGLRLAYHERRWPRTGTQTRRVGALQPFRRIQRQLWALLQEKNSLNQLGLSLTAPVLQAEDPYSPWDLHALRRQESFHAWYAPEPATDRAYSFAAVAYHGSRSIRCAPLKPRRQFAQYAGPAAIATADALRHALTVAGGYDVPVLLTNTGIAADDDHDRCRFLLDLAHVLLEEPPPNIPLMGCCYRSLLDGFEWHHGFTRRFGLVHVDRKTLVRTPNPSAFLYQDIARHGAIRPGTVARFCPDWRPPVREAC